VLYCSWSELKVRQQICNQINRTCAAIPTSKFAQIYSQLPNPVLSTISQTNFQNFKTFQNNFEELFTLELTILDPRSRHRNGMAVEHNNLRETNDYLQKSQIMTADPGSDLEFHRN
jgi:hypothetical protein